MIKKYFLDNWHSRNVYMKNYIENGHRKSMNKIIVKFIVGKVEQYTYNQIPPGGGLIFVWLKRFDEKLKNKTPGVVWGRDSFKSLAVKFYVLSKQQILRNGTFKKNYHRYRGHHWKYENFFN